ncbi:unnamed protein product [Spirodela intermedia]|uniref:Uncharacterized protein n=1 Tax=Spirodela intermedia TaxID=51605 RepID=A0A7I8KB15_SPIIN|nr:unnamed protein product [Spirodela intermedia]
MGNPIPARAFAGDEGEGERFQTMSSIAATCKEEYFIRVAGELRPVPTRNEQDEVINIYVIEFLVDRAANKESEPDNRRSMS